MKKLLLTFLTFFLITSNLPAGCESKEFVAVFSMPGTKDCWRDQKPDLFFTASDWDDFDLFLKVVKKEAKSRKIVIDIDSHGSVDGELYIEYKNFGVTFSQEANLGYICNEIEKYISPKKITLLLESCCSAAVYKNLHEEVSIHSDGDCFEPYKYTRATLYPIYGVGEQLCWDNVIFLQRKYGLYAAFKDLREWENKKVGHIDIDPKSITNESLRQVDAYLRALSRIH